MSTQTVNKIVSTSLSLLMLLSGAPISAFAKSEKQLSAKQVHPKPYVRNAKVCGGNLPDGHIYIPGSRFVCAKPEDIKMVGRTTSRANVGGIRVDPNTRLIVEGDKTVRLFSGYELDKFLPFERISISQKELIELAKAGDLGEAQKYVSEEIVYAEKIGKHQWSVKSIQDGREIRQLGSKAFYKQYISKLGPGIYAPRAAYVNAFAVPERMTVEVMGENGKTVLRTVSKGDVLVQDVSGRFSVMSAERLEKNYVQASKWSQHQYNKLLKLLETLSQKAESRAANLLEIVRMAQGVRVGAKQAGRNLERNVGADIEARVSKSGNRILKQAFKVAGPLAVVGLLFLSAPAASAQTDTPSSMNKLVKETTYKKIASEVLQTLPKDTVEKMRHMVFLTHPANQSKIEKDPAWLGRLAYYGTSMTQQEYENLITMTAKEVNKQVSQHIKGASLSDSYAVGLQVFNMLNAENKCTKKVC